MEQLYAIADKNPVRVILSNPNASSEYRRITLTRTEQAYQAEKLTQTQAFHERVPEEDLAVYLRSRIDDGLRQLNAWDGQGVEYALKRTKKGGSITSTKRTKAAVPSVIPHAHNRQKHYLIPEGADIPVLYDMGIFTKSGAVAADMQAKFRQINRFMEIINDACGHMRQGSIKIADFGCGKSYLTFLLYHYFTKTLGIRVEMLGLDVRDDVIAACADAAKRYGYDGLTFRRGDAANFGDGFAMDILVSLHACDTATDHALYHAVKQGARAIFAVPCCQHELNAQLRPSNLTLISRYGIIKERAAALLTDAIRANLLTYMGYKTQLLEFIDMEHTPKNIMLRAVKAPIAREKRRAAYDEAMQAVKEFNLSPTLLRLTDSLPLA